MKSLEPAFHILSAYYPDPGQNLKLAMNRYLDGLTPGIRPRVSRLVYGVIRHQNTLDHILDQRSQIPPEKITGDTQIWLRMGLFLLAFSRPHPPHAVVNEIVKRSSPGARGYVNAMLRNLARNRESVIEKARRLDDPLVRYSISGLLASGLEKISDRLDQDLDYLNREPLFHLRPNTWRISLSELEKRLTREKIAFRPCAGLDCLEIKNAGPALHRIVARGAGYLQNTGSQLVCLMAARQAQRTVLDGCAAPGTKSVTLKQVKPELTVVANDRRLGRLRLIHRFQGIRDSRGLHPLVSDLLTPALKNRFDLVLVDAPCTASGTLRKNPDLKLKITPDMAREQGELQLRMLESARNNFPSSDILYSVCSFLPDETEAVMDRFSPLKRGYRIGDLSGWIDGLGFRYRKARWGVYLLPDDRLNNDLFYLVLMTPSGPVTG